MSRSETAFYIVLCIIGLVYVFGYKGISTSDFVESTVYTLIVCIGIAILNELGKGLFKGINKLANSVRRELGIKKKFDK